MSPTHFNSPAQPFWLSILLTTRNSQKVFDIYAEHIYPFLPILPLPTTACSLPTFLLYALFVICIPYLPRDTLRSMGYADCEAAQLEFFTRARLLYDFGCEDDELVLLQGSVLFGCFQHSFDMVKESRYWFGNAVRLGKQLGVYRR